MATTSGTGAGSAAGIISALSKSSPQHQAQVKTCTFDLMDKGDISLLSNTLKHNPKMELSKTDLLKLLSCLEGELQARDVVIATLKAEKVKMILVQAKYGTLSLSDPYAALQRDSLGGGECSSLDEASLRVAAENQRTALENLIGQQRRAQFHMTHILRDAEERHRKVVQELDEERQKHEHDTAQGDDITYGLEKDRTRLKQELDLERQAKKKAEKELKKATDTLEEERGRQKQIVLLLLAERKKIITKYIEERKRSEDLAQILAEEKGRIDSMAEGLEEESKKSLQMEAELEKQLAQFDMEREQLKGLLLKEENRRKDLEAEIEKLKAEVESMKKQMAEAHSVAMFQASTSLNTPCMVLTRPQAPLGGTLPPQPPAKPTTLPPQTPPRMGQAQGAPAMMGSVTKVVQPTATVTSVPVCGPTTGIARSVSPGQGLKNIAYTMASSEPRSVSTLRTSAAGGVDQHWSSAAAQSPGQDASNTSAAPMTRLSQTLDRNQQAQVVQITPRVSVSASPGTKVFTTAQGSKVTFHVTTNATSSSAASATSAGSSPAMASGANGQPLKKGIPLGRGVPPPVPPNKPVVPPKKEVVRTIGRGSGGGAGGAVGGGGGGGSGEVAPCPVMTSVVDTGQPIQFEVKKGVPQGVKFGITISKDKIQITNPDCGDAVVTSSDSSSPVPPQQSNSVCSALVDSYPQVGEPLPAQSDAATPNSGVAQPLANNVAANASLPDANTCPILSPSMPNSIVATPVITATPHKTIAKPSANTLPPKMPGTNITTTTTSNMIIHATMMTPPKVAIPANNTNLNKMTPTKLGTMTVAPALDLTPANNSARIPTVCMSPSSPTLPPPPLTPPPTPPTVTPPAPSPSADAPPDSTPPSTPTPATAAASAIPQQAHQPAEATVARTSPALHETQPSLDSLHQELADFQQLLVSMASGSADLASLCVIPSPPSPPSATTMAPAAASSVVVTSSTATATCTTVVASVEGICTEGSLQAGESAAN